MGWAYGVNAEGREVGYSVQASCDEPQCSAEIDRGLGYVCGGMHGGGEYGCGEYFCSDHLCVGSVDGKAQQFCDRCYRDDEERRR